MAKANSPPPPRPLDFARPQPRPLDFARPQPRPKPTLKEIVTASFGKPRVRKDRTTLDQKKAVAAEQKKRSTTTQATKELMTGVKGSKVNFKVGGTVNSRGNKGAVSGKKFSGSY